MTASQHLIVALGSLLVCANAQAKNHEPKSAYILIADGAKSKTQAKAKAKAFKARAEWILAKGYPKVIDSKTIKGLNPGFHILVLGFCPQSSATAEVLLPALKKTYPGLYMKEVSHGADSCPTQTLPKITPWSDCQRVCDRIINACKSERFSGDGGDAHTSCFMYCDVAAQFEGQPQPDEFAARVRKEMLCISQARTCTEVASCAPEP